MSASLPNNRSEEGDIIVQGILRQISALPETEEEFTIAVQNISLNLRSLVIIAMNTERRTVTEWQQALERLPNAIGLHPEFSNPAQQRIDQFREIIEQRINEDLEELGGSAICDGDSGINLQHDSGINLGIL